jgi:hypothetical protein
VFLTEDTHNKEPNQKLAKDKPIGDGAITKYANVFAYVSSVASGAYVMDLGIRKAAYKNWVTKDIFKPLQDKYEGLYRDIIDVATHDNRLQTIEKVVENNEEYRSKVQTFFREKGFENIHDYWRILTRNQKAQNWVEGLTVTGISLGAMLTVINSKSWKKYFGAEENENDRGR